MSTNGPTFNVRVQFDATERMRLAAKRAQFIVDQQVIKDSNYYCPQDTGNLQGSALLASPVGEGKVIWNTPYARRLYYNPQYNFSKDKNMNARGYWFEAAKSQYKAKWIQMGKDAFHNG